MHQETLIKAIDSYLGQLESLLGTALAVAILVFWSGLRGHKEITAVGLKLSRRHAFFIVGAFYSVINVAILVTLLRLDSVLSNILSVNRLQALTVLCTHRWIFSPFAFYGDSLLAQTGSVWGFGALIVAWWFCHTSLFLLGAPEDEKRAGAYLVRNIVSGIFLAVGLASIGAINKIYFTVMSSQSDLPKEIPIQIIHTAIPRQIFTFAGIAVGALLFGISVRAAKKQKPNR